REFSLPLSLEKINS
ncbi:unnamed protein product, partial [Allacma fusca]